MWRCNGHDMRALVCLFLGLVASTLAGNHDKYSGYTVYGVHIDDHYHQKVLSVLQRDIDLDVWRHGVPKARDALVMVSPENRLQFLKILEENNMHHYIHLHDVARSLKQSDDDFLRWKLSRGNELSIFEDYPTYGDVIDYMERIARNNSAIATLVNAGNSFEGRPVKYLKISTTNFTDTSKPIYFLEATMHAREWVTTQTALYTIHRLIEDLKTEDRDLIEGIDWIIFPVVNPDGYEFSHTTDRMWRKTRSFNATISATCYGVDPNRNFDIEFNTVSVSPDPCSQIYPGHEAFSEPETRYVRDILLEYNNRIQVFMDVHSYGNYIVYGFDNGTLPQNALHIHHVGALMGAAIDTLKLQKAPFYIVGNSRYVFYAVSGSGQDYAQAVGVGFSYTIELPGYEYDFRVPPSYINQINTETWEGVAASARAARSYIVYGVKLEDQVDQEVLYGLQSELDLDLWEYGVPKVKDVLVMVSPDKKERFLDILDRNYIKHYLHLSDVAQALEENDNDLSSWERESSRVFEKYARYAEIDAYLEEVAQAHPRIVTLVNAGLSFEGRPIKYLKISTSNFTDPSKPVYFIDAAMHAREWITIPPALYSIHRLVEDLREQDRDLLEEIDWIVMPLERLWRKTRSFNVTRHPECYGVDANRNFDVDFYGTGSSTNPCVNTFRGHEPFSEPETRCVRDVILEHIDRLQVYLNVHSHGNLILYGYGNKTLPSNVVQLHQVGAIMGAAIDHKKLLEAPYYLVGNSALVLYTSSGSAQDYGQVVGVPFSYTLELPGMGYGFQIPVRFVNQVNMETWEGIAASARIAKIYYRARDQK
ncbi:hypothetical protein KGM_212730 [Danaus plexippus plexippus]|uniref:Peptidase M14 domain-containing protein n=1 Tax=Danaus plexippus plexippus TaxID=278856 RepID=A0A212FM32_DANPL|nr:hypothetical protein KGM_212730 [Danaus plexippus plexippus]